MPCVLQIDTVEEKNTFFVDSQLDGSDMANFGNFEKKGEKCIFFVFFNDF